MRTISCLACHALPTFTVVAAAPGLPALDDDCALWVAGSTAGCVRCEVMAEYVLTRARAQGPLYTPEDHAVATRIFGGAWGVSTAPLS